MPDVAYVPFSLAELSDDVELTPVVSTGDLLMFGLEGKWRNLEHGPEGYILTSHGDNEELSWEPPAIPTSLNNGGGSVAVNLSGAITLTPASGQPISLINNDVGFFVDADNEIRVMNASRTGWRNLTFGGFYAYNSATVSGGFRAGQAVVANTALSVTPGAVLHVVNSDASQPVLRLDCALGQSANAFEVRDSDRVIKASIDASGTIRAAQSEFAGAATLGYYGSTDFAKFQHVGANTYGLLQGVDGATYLNAAAGRSIHFRIDNSEKMTMDSNGNLSAASATIGDNTLMLGGQGGVQLIVRRSSADIVAFGRNAFLAPFLALASNALVTWGGTANSVNAIPDTDIHRASAGVVGIGDGAGGLGNLSAAGATFNTGGSIKIAGLPGVESSYGALWMAQGSPSGSNYALTGSANETILNATNIIYLRLNNGIKGTLDSTGLALSGNLSANQGNFGGLIQNQNGIYWNNFAGLGLTTTAGVPGRLILESATAAVALGGITGAYPMLKRNGTGIDFRLADDSAYANIAVAGLDVEGRFNDEISVRGTGKIHHSGGAFYIDDATHDLALQVGSVGSVGIGIYNPSEKLHVDGNILSTGGITSSTRISIYNGGIEQAYFDDSGNLGITGAIKSSLADSAPGDPTVPVAWKVEYVDGVPYKRPLYL